MINTSTEYKNKILSQHRILKMKVVFNGHQEIDGHYLKNVSIHEVSNGTDTLSLGTMCSNSIKITMFDPGDILYDNASVKLSIGLKIDESVEWIPMGTFIISQVNRENDYEVSLEGYDKATSFNVDYQPHIIYPALLQDVVEDIAMQCNVSVKQQVFEAIVIDKAMDVTCKEMIGYMASLMGKNIRINRENQLEFFWYSDKNYKVERSHQFEDSFKRTNSLLTISSLTSGTEENTIVSGSGYGITFPNPYMTQERLNQLLEELNGFSYTPCSVKWRGDPSLEVGDILSVEELDSQYIRVLMMDNVISFDGGMSSSVECAGQNEKEVVMSKSPTEIKLKKLYNTLMNSYKDITEKILGHHGGYYSVDMDEDGQPSGWTIMDSPTLREDTHLWKMSMGGFGYSEDGGKTFKNFAFDLDGNFTANAITTGVLQGNKFDLDLQTGFICIGNRNSEGKIDDVYFSFNEEGLYLRSLGEMNDRIDKNASNISQIKLSVEGIQTMVKDVQETLVTVKNYFVKLVNVIPIISQESQNSYEYVDETLVLLAVEPGDFQLYSKSNLISSFSNNSVYSLAIDMNAELIEDETLLLNVTIGNKTTDLLLTKDSKRFIVEGIHFLDNENIMIHVNESLKRIVIQKLDLTEGETYVESRIGLQEISTQVNQSGNTIEFVKRGLEQISDELGSYVTQKNLEEYIRFDGAQITLGKSDSAFKTVITNSKMSFFDGDMEVAYISNNALHIEDAIINRSLTIGKFSWKPRNNGNLSLVKVN